ncbi:MAG: DUF2271 domain-containing protein [Planctomycetota bacterium]
MLRKVLCFALLLVAHPCAADEFQFHHENVLGTSCEITLHCDSQEDAIAAEKVALAEIDRLTKILSGYDADSEWSKLLGEQGSTEVLSVSRELRNVLEQGEQIRQQTAGAFDFRAGALSKLWNSAAKENRIPTAMERAAVTSRLANAPYELTEAGLRWNTELNLSTDGLAKGYVIDQVAQRLIEMKTVTGCCVNIGGDLKVLGDAKASVSIENPFRPMEGAAPLLGIRSEGVAVSTSGNYRRIITVAGRRFSHILDPRSGMPVDHVVSATVVAPTASASDALATAFSVMPVADSLALAEQLDKTECFLVLAGGETRSSMGWPSSNAPKFVAQEKEAKEGLIVDFKINRPKGRRYRRPYVAVWLEDKDGFPVKTSVLWMQTDQPGPRWHRDLTRWYRNDRLRKTVEKTNLIETISGATRGPGTYQAVFDGKDNAGKVLEPATYTLCLEVAREHGTYQIIRKKIDIGEKAIEKTELEGNVEMGDVSFSYVPPTTKKIQ